MPCMTMTLKNTNNGLLEIKPSTLSIALSRLGPLQNESKQLVLIRTDKPGFSKNISI